MGASPGSPRRWISALSSAPLSGLGLFLCRELCRRHGAAIGYERRALAADGPEGNEFFVGFAASENRLTQ